MTPVERAAKMLRENRFATMATIDANGPWAVPINYVLGPGRVLTFYSAIDSRHARAVVVEDRVSGAVFDSRASSEEVDGLQFDGVCTSVVDDTLETVHAHYFDTNFADPTERAWWLRPATDFGTGGRWHFYQIAISGL